MKLLSSSQKKKITKQLNLQFGITNIPYLMIKFGKERLRLYSGNLSKEELLKLDKNLRIETAGLYFAKQVNDGIRLTIDGLHILQSQITKNILILTKEQSDNWFLGDDLQIKLDKNFKILKYDKDFLGSGKSTGEKITNTVPKERRVKG